MTNTNSEFTNLAFYSARLSTFKGWSKQLQPNKYDLAKAGLYYTGHSDKVECFCCHGVFYEWESSDDPFVEHEKWSPECAYLKMTGFAMKENCATDVNEYNQKVATKGNNVIFNSK